MKIAFLANQTNCISGRSNGIRMQALVWKNALEKKGHLVDLIQTWGVYDWKSYDVIHLFGCGEVFNFIESLKSFNDNIFLSPIIDSDKSLFSYKLASYCGCKTLRLISQNYKLRLVKDLLKGFFVRSNYEAQFLLKSYGIESQKIHLVPLSYRQHISSDEKIKKENFCLHVSSFTQPRKNAMRLIDAAIKYGFNLKIVGSCGSTSSFEPFRKKIEANENIEYLGFVSDDELVELYRKAKVFALPSTYEGVGLVALEAAVYGAEIVITNIGGPKEYYGKLAYLVDPYSVDAIGKAIVSAMNGGKQPELSKMIKKRYNVETCVDELIAAYSK